MSVTIDGYPIDIALSIDYSRKSDVSSYPAERGTNFSDNTRVNEPDLTFEGLISDTPIGSIAEHPTRVGVASVGASAFQRLDAMQVAGQPLTVGCSLGIFDSMEITNLKVTRDSKTRKGLKFTVTFSRLRIIDNAKTTIVVGTGTSNDFGLSLSRLHIGDKVLWRKGKPPGSNNIVGKEIIKVVDIKDDEFHRQQLQHLDGRPLSTTSVAARPGPLLKVDEQLAEQEAFFLDFQRDVKIYRSRQPIGNLDDALAFQNRKNSTAPIQKYVTSRSPAQPLSRTPLTDTLTK